jgi:hypothetical protein
MSLNLSFVSLFKNYYEFKCIICFTIKNHYDLFHLSDDRSEAFFHSQQHVDEFGRISRIDESLVFPNLISNFLRSLKSI